MEPTQALAKVVQENRLDASMGQQLVALYAPFFEAAKTALEESAGVVVTDPTDVTGIKKSRALRLTLKALRCDADAKRRELKDGALRMGRAIDFGYKLLTTQTEPEEARLEAQENIAKRLEAERKAKLATERMTAIRPYISAPECFDGSGLAEMTPGNFSELLGGMKAAHEKRIADAKAADEARRREEDERESREAELESQSLAEKGKRLAAERLAAAEREARRRAEDEAMALKAKAKAIRDAEADKKREEEAALRASAAAPDKEKLAALAKTIRIFAQSPKAGMATTDGAEILGYAILELGRLAKEIERRALAL